MTLVGAFGTLTNSLRYIWSFTLNIKSTLNPILTKSCLTFFIGYYVFSICGYQLDQKFINSIKIYILNSLVYSATEMILELYFLADIEVIYELSNFNFPFYSNYQFMLYSVYITHSAASWTFLFFMGQNTSAKAWPQVFDQYSNNY